MRGICSITCMRGGRFRRRDGDLHVGDSVVLAFSNVAAAKQWWIQMFDCKPAKMPDVALALPGVDEPAILLSVRREAEQAGLDWSNDHPIVFCYELKRAHEYLRERGASPSPIRDGGGTEFFEILDTEGNLIEICNEP
jgi:hypothetical protein